MAAVSWGRNCGDDDDKLTCLAKQAPSTRNCSSALSWVLRMHSLRARRKASEAARMGKDLAVPDPASAGVMGGCCACEPIAVLISCREISPYCLLTGKLWQPELIISIR